MLFVMLDNNDVVYQVEPHLSEDPRRSDPDRRPGGEELARLEKDEL